MVILIMNQALAFWFGVWLEAGGTILEASMSGVFSVPRSSL